MHRKTQARKLRRGHGGLIKEIRRHWVLFLMTIPALACFFIFRYLPLPGIKVGWWGPAADTGKIATTPGVNNTAVVSSTSENPGRVLMVVEMQTQLADFEPVW